MGHDHHGAQNAVKPRKHRPNGVQRQRYDGAPNKHSFHGEPPQLHVFDAAEVPPAEQHVQQEHGQARHFATSGHGLGPRAFDAVVVAGWLLDTRQEQFEQHCHAHGAREGGQALAGAAPTTRAHTHR